MTKRTTINIHKKYKPLFLEKTRYYVIIGGRGSGKSFVVSLYGTLKLKNKNERGLFTRYTLASAYDSIIPEYNEKIELLNETDNFDVTKFDIENKESGSKIVFRGIKTSSGVQTAKLKSLTDVTFWILDEADELTDEETFDKIDLSIRSQKSNNIVILVLNPSYRSHWIYKRFFEKANVPELFNGVKNDVTYIHTTYLDNIKNLSESFLKNADETKETNKQKYNETFLGFWKDQPEGIVFEKAKLKRFNISDLTTEQAAAVVAHTDVADQGDDSLSFIIGKIYGSKVFITNVVHSKKGAEYTKNRIVSLQLEHNVNENRVESNNMGAMYSYDLKRISKEYNCNTTVTPYPQNTNKISRIVANSEFIMQNFYFLNDTEFEHGSDYDLFLNELTSFNVNGKNKNDDAPDTTSGLAFYIRIKKLIQI